MPIPLLAGMGSYLAGASGYGLLGAGLVYDQFTRRQDYRTQKEFAKHGLTWRMNQARQAGLHPLTAVGGSGPSYSPTRRAGINPAMAFINFKQQKAELGIQRERLKQMRLATARLAGQTVAKTDSLGIRGQGTTVSNGVYQDPQRPTSQSVGVESYMYPQDAYTIDVDGNADLALTQLTSEPAESDAYFRAKRFAREGYRHFKSITGAITKPMPRQKPGKDHVWAWNRWQNNWQRVHKRKIKPMRSLKKRTIKYRQRYPYDYTP